jgi:ATP-dependent Clp protease ATP-binding subunit ClpC
MEGTLVQSVIVPTIYRASSGRSCFQVRATMLRSMPTETLTLGGFHGLRQTNFLDTRSVIKRDFGSIVASQVARPRGRGSRAVVRAMFERFTEKAIKVSLWRDILSPSSLDHLQVMWATLREAN